MKRALAERAKQSFDSVRANPPPPPAALPSNDRRTPQHPPAVYGNADANISSSSSRAHELSSSDHLPISDKLLQHSGDRLSTTTPAEQRATDSFGRDCRNPADPAGSTSEPPTKMQRLERSIDSSTNHANHNDNNSSPQSPRSPRNLPKKNVLGRTSASTSSSGTFQPPFKRRFSGETAAAPELELSSSGRGSKKRIKNESDEEDAAFYLKQQNRALATELKSLQFAVKQLEEERDARRRHCREALHVVQELQNTWTSIEKDTVGATFSAGSTPTPDSALETTNDPPSTGTGDSVEWTRALQASLLALGRGRAASDIVALTPALATTALTEAATNIAARAKILQQWLGTLAQSRGAAADAAVPHGSSDSGDKEQRLHNLQREMGVVTAQCAELEAHVSELVASRNDIASRERRVRRNVYRMASGIMTSDQVINTMVRGEGDELEAEVQLEKQSMAKPADTAVMEPSNQKQIDGVSVAQIEEYKAKMIALEESLSNAENSIIDVRIFMWSRMFFRFGSASNLIPLFDSF